MTQISSGFYLEATFFVFTESEKRMVHKYTFNYSDFEVSFLVHQIGYFRGYWLHSRFCQVHYEELSRTTQFLGAAVSLSSSTQAIHVVTF